MFSGDRQRQDRHLVTEFSAAVESEVRILAKRLQQVFGTLCHREHPYCLEKSRSFHKERNGLPKSAIVDNAIVNSGEAPMPGGPVARLWRTRLA